MCRRHLWEDLARRYAELDEVARAAAGTWGSDLLHEVLLRMLEEGAHRSVPSNLLGYVRRAVRNRLVSRLRREARRSEVPLTLQDPLSLSLSLSGSPRSTLERIANRLSVRERKVLASWSAGLPLKQIARDLRLDVRQVKRSLVKCAAALMEARQGSGSKSVPPGRHVD